MDSTDSYIEESTSSKWRNFCNKFKLEVVKYAQNHNKANAAGDKIVPRTCVKNWINQKMQLESQLQQPCSISSDKRLHGAGRPFKDTDFDEKLIAWVREQCLKKIPVSRTLIQKQALAFSSDSSFRAGNGWLVNFLNRHNLVSRRPTRTCLKEPEHYIEKCLPLMGLSNLLQRWIDVGISEEDPWLFHFR